MPDTKISGLTDGVTAVATDRIPVARSPFGPTDNRYVTPAYIKDYLLGLANTFVGNQTINGGSLTLSGNISAPAWTTGGIRFRGVAATLTDTSSSGTVASACTNAYGGNTIAASSATTFTNYFTSMITQPTAGTNVTFTNRWALGITGNLQVAGLINIPQGTITTNQPLFDATTTWNAAGVAFTAWQLAVTKTAAAAASRVLDMTVGGTSRLSVWPDAAVNATSGIGVGAQSIGAGVRMIGFVNALYVMLGDVSDYASVYARTLGLAGDAFLTRDAAEVVAQRNLTAAQSFRWYYTFTNNSNHQRGALNTGSDYVEVAAETAGTGADDLDVRLTPAGAGRVRFGSHSALAAETVTGYITIKDSGGTSRKLAVVS